MSLITCIECGKIFSDKASACPNCACPTAYIINSKEKDQPIKSSQNTAKPEDFEIKDSILIKYIGNSEFVQVPLGVRGIEKAAFRCCKTVKSIVLPKTIEYIESQAFEACLNLKEINIPPLIKTIPTHAFRNCRKLASIILPEGLEKIHAHAFSRCYDLNNVYLPSTLVFISFYAFNNCDIRNIYYNGTQDNLKNLFRQHTILNSLYRISCKDGLWNYFDKDCPDTAQTFNINHISDDDFKSYHCEICGKTFIPTFYHTYRDNTPDYDSENFYCSWKCFQARDLECCYKCNKNFMISRDNKGNDNSYKDDDDNYYCSFKCLEHIQDEND